MENVKGHLRDENQKKELTQPPFLDCRISDRTMLTLLHG